MKKLIPIFAILLGWAAAACAEPPGTLTTLRDLSTLSSAEARKGLPVAFEGTVTYYRGYEHLLFVQDGGLAVFVYATVNAKLVPGDRVLIKGITRVSFHAIAVSQDVTVLHHGPLPSPVSANFSDLILGQHDCLLVKMHGVIRAADLVWSTQAHVRSASLQVLTDGGYVEVLLDSDNQEALNNLLDDEVEVVGAAGGEFDDKMQQTGIVLHVSTWDNIKILKSANANLWDLPVTPMNRIMGGYHIKDSTSRIRVQGTITYYQPGSAVVLQGGGRSLWIRTSSDIPLRIGDMADATGFPEVMITDQARSANDGFLSLTHSEIRDSHVPAPVTPLYVTWQQLAVSGDQGVGHHFDLVSIDGEVAVQERGGARTQDEYTLIADGHKFSAIYRHPSGALTEMKQIPWGSRVRVTGICFVHNSNPFGGPVAFDILLRSFDDIEVIKSPSLLNIPNLVLLVCLLLAIVALVGGWGWKLERKVRRQTAALAARERQRSRILVDINGSRPLAEILNKIVGMVSSMLDGAVCWCELADGTTVGDCPREPHSLEIVRVKIDARSGPALGALMAALGPESPTAARRTEALADGVRLATLAIETRRLYSDLRHRSEYDLLTEIPNRFAMEKRMDILIEEARQSSGIFGLIYIDLDEFKLVNDRYGHRIGDLYLQEVAVRMKRQLRGGDILARLGGDEFAALVTVVHSRADVEEAVHRLQRCFDTPFAVGEHSLWGEASIGIALYPEDGLTRDSLLSVADAAMYAVKNSKQ
jgi:diguanylate cyclase (GGDEF)-like protein